MRLFIAHKYLHSIMYLLIRSSKKIKQVQEAHLHSIMYLLIQESIIHPIPKSPNLHSIMYLLIREWRRAVHEHHILFTFHNVSINSNTLFYKQKGERDLHSIMYLLIQMTACRR